MAKTTKKSPEKENPPKLPQKKKSPSSFSRPPSLFPSKSTVVKSLSNYTTSSTSTTRSTPSISRSGRESKSSSPPDLERISPPTFGNYKRLSLQNSSFNSRQAKSSMKAEPQVRKAGSVNSLRQSSQNQPISSRVTKGLTTNSRNSSVSTSLAKSKSTSTTSIASAKSATSAVNTRSSSLTSNNIKRSTAARNTIPMAHKSGKIASESLAQRAKTTSEERLSKFRKNMTRSTSLEQKSATGNIGSKRKSSVTSTASESDQDSVRSSRMSRSSSLSVSSDGLSNAKNKSRFSPAKSKFSIKSKLTSSTKSTKDVKPGCSDKTTDSNLKVNIFYNI